MRLLGHHVPMVGGHHVGRHVPMVVLGFCFRILPFSAISLFPSLAEADGGALRLSEQKGGYRIAAFTTPTPLRAGPVDISLLVQDAVTGEPASGVQPSIKVQRHDNHSAALYQRATTQAATNKLYYAATCNLPEAGWYSVEVSIVGAPRQTHVCFDVEAAEPLPSGLAMLPWVGWPLLVIAIFVVHQLLVRWRSGRAAGTMYRSLVPSGWSAVANVPLGPVNQLPHQ